MTEDEIESMMAEEQEDGRQLRRSTRGSKR